MFCGANDCNLSGRVATYVDKILKGGAERADLPLEQPTGFYFVLLKTAKAVGLKLLNSAPMQAAKVIE